MTLRILYVDDEPDIREIACLALSLDPDLDIRSCESGAEAVEAATEWKPDLVLLDVMMPRMDGPQTLAAMRDRADLASIPVVFITARTQTADIERLKTLGAAGVIAKPFDPMSLAATARGFIGQ
jgi:CheY-like chemotaxis protein